jgi:hypothetical protein
MSEIELQLSREALVPAHLLWGYRVEDEEPAVETYEISERSAATYGNDYVSLFQCDAAAVRGVQRLEDGRKVGALVAFRPPVSHEKDETLLQMAKPMVEREIKRFLEKNGLQPCE